jgi:transposase
MSGGSSRRYPPELRERAVRMVAEISDQHDSEWAAISEVARLLGVGTAETVRKWVRQAQVDSGSRPGTTTEESAELKRLKRENAGPRSRGSPANSLAQTSGCTPPRPPWTSWEKRTLMPVIVIGCGWRRVW